MNAKKVKRMCNVKGCRNTDTYAISRIKEFGGVIICKSCLEEALKATESADKQAEVHKKQKETPLFYHPAAESTAPMKKTANNTKKSTETSKSNSSGASRRGNEK